MDLSEKLEKDSDEGTTVGARSPSTTRRAERGFRTTKRTRPILSEDAFLVKFPEIDNGDRWSMETAERFIFTGRKTAIQKLSRKGQRSIQVRRFNGWIDEAGDEDSRASNLSFEHQEGLHPVGEMKVIKPALLTLVLTWFEMETQSSWECK